MPASGRRILLQRPGPERVVVIDVLAQDQSQVPFAGDQHPVQALAPGAGDPTFGNRVHQGRPGGGLIIRTPMAVNTASNAAVNLASRLAWARLPGCQGSVIRRQRSGSEPAAASEDVRRIAARRAAS